VRDQHSVFALLADGRVLVVRPNGRLLAETRLAPPPPPGTDRATGHYLVLSSDGHYVLTLVPGRPEAPDRLAVVDAGSGQVQVTFPLPDTVTFRSLALGPQTGRVFLFGNAGEVVRPPGLDSLAPRQVSVVVAVLDPARGLVVDSWTVRPTDGHDWRVYQGAVSTDERQLFVSYHGPDTTGIDRFDLAPDGPHRCPDAALPGRGCLDGHGGFALHQDGLLAATGTPVVVELDQTDAVRRGLDTALTGNHLMEFVVDEAVQRLYAVGSCGYAGGFSAVSLHGAGVPTTPTVPGEWAWIATPEPPPRLRRGGACGERLALGGANLLVVGKTQQPVPQSGRLGALLMLDPSSGDVTSTVPTPSEPIDVLVAPRPPVSASAPQPR
jgi:hypothetical protein